MDSKPLNIQYKLFKFFLSFYLRRITKRIWLADQPAQRITEEDLNLILDRSWQKYFASAAQLEKQANLGNWLVMNLAHLTLAAYQVLLDYGFDEQASVDHVFQLTWELTSTWTKRAKRVSGVFFPDPMRELAYYVNLVMKTFFSPPAYKFDTGKVNEGFFLDVKRCPVANLMASNGASELCIQSWCGVDFGLVEILGGSLKREGTLAMGKQKCDFVFQPSQKSAISI